jgi:hypothetical protein
MQMLGGSTSTFDFFVILSLQHIDSMGDLAVPGAHPPEIFCFPFIVLEQTNDNGLGVRVFDQQQIFVKPEWQR